MFKKLLYLFILFLFAVRISYQHLPSDNLLKSVVLVDLYDDSTEGPEESKENKETGDEDDTDFELILSSSSTLSIFNEIPFHSMGKYLPPSFKRQSPPPEFC